MSRRILGPFNRVEGDLDVRVDVSDGVVEQAFVNSPLFRGFEQILHGKDPRDALVYTPRICGICSVSQSVAAANALAAAQGLTPARNGLLATNLILACENAADHLTHFYLFFMPDFARAPYQSRAWFEDTRARFAAQTGEVSRQVLKARAHWLHITGVLAGKWPHSLSIQPGGSTRGIEPQERVRLLSIIGEFREFLEQQLFGDALEAVIELSDAQALEQWLTSHPGSDFGRFLHIAEDLSLSRLGELDSLMMSYGAYQRHPEDTAESGDERVHGHAFRAGVFDTQGRKQPLDTDAIREDISHSGLCSSNGPRHPYEGSTIPDTNFDPSDPQDPLSGAYSWCKAPRLEGSVVEVGALARQAVDGHPLIRDLLRQDGSNVHNRVIARVLELAMLVPLMEQWALDLKPREPFCLHGELPETAQGAGLVEAARGSLGHWLRIKNGRILNYQIIAPTTWNFSPRDEDGVPGPLEQALVGTPVSATENDGDEHLSVSHVVRSFDPCMVCTVH